jgi:hypothetical protein
LKEHFIGSLDEICPDHAGEAPSQRAIIQLGEHPRSEIEYEGSLGKGTLLEGMSGNLRIALAVEGQMQVRATTEL